jgi:hypothetical protein
MNAFWNVTPNAHSGNIGKVDRLIVIRIFDRITRPETLIYERRAPKEIIGALFNFLKTNRHGTKKILVRNGSNGS